LGIINLYKPTGITSYKATQKVQKLVGAYKAGHAGTLDPEAEGILLVCLNEATRISEYLSELDKQYIVKIKFGLTTDTYDITGNILLKKDPSQITKKMILEQLKNFFGEIQQEPPMFSAIKKHGIPLYKLARKGIIIKRKKRLVKIYNIELLDYIDNEAIISVVCSKGTYIRSLVNDIGKALKVGAVVKELKRTRIGDFSYKTAVSFEDIEKGKFKIYSIDEALKHLQAILLGPKEYKLAVYGTGFKIPLCYKKGTLIRLLDPKGKFFAIGVIKNKGELKIEKVLFQP